MSITVNFSVFDRLTSPRLQVWFYLIRLLTEYIFSFISYMQHYYITWHPRKLFVSISKNEVLIYMRNEEGYSLSVLQKLVPIVTTDLWYVKCGMQVTSKEQLKESSTRAFFCFLDGWIVVSVHIKKSCQQPLQHTLSWFSYFFKENGEMSAKCSNLYVLLYAPKAAFLIWSNQN